MVTIRAEFWGARLADRLISMLRVGRIVAVIK
jgi:hypothetical protein